MRDDGKEKMQKQKQKQKQKQAAARTVPNRRPPAKVAYAQTVSLAAQLNEGTG